jgi:mono/diheme cytochrome c family protein
MALIAAALALSVAIPADAARHVSPAKARAARLQQQRAERAAMVARGEYLVTVAGCGTCHTPGYFFGHADRTRWLAGSDVGFAVPKQGVFVPPNLTPDRETGLGRWSRAQIIAAFTKGMRPDGRKLSSIMPWRDYARLTGRDALAIADYLQSLKPVKQAVPARFGPDDTVTRIYVMTLLAPGVYNGAPEPRRADIAPNPAEKPD